MVFRRCGGYRLHASSVYRANIKRHKTLLFYYFNTCYHLSLKSEKERIHYYVKKEKISLIVRCGGYEEKKMISDFFSTIWIALHCS